MSYYSVVFSYDYKIWHNGKKVYKLVEKQFIEKWRCVQILFVAVVYCWHWRIWCVHLSIHTRTYLCIYRGNLNIALFIRSVCIKQRKFIRNELRCKTFARGDTCNVQCANEALPLLENKSRYYLSDQMKLIVCGRFKGNRSVVIAGSWDMNDVYCKILMTVIVRYVG